MELKMPSPARPASRSRFLILLLLGVLAVAGLYALLHQPRPLILEDARLLFPEIWIEAPIEGVVAESLVRPGQKIDQGTPLFSYQRADLEKAVQEGRLELAAIRRSLPPLVAAHIEDGPPDLGAWEARVREESRQERDARERVQAASVREAQAAVRAERARDGSNSARARQALAAARAETAAAREAFEKVSLQRHASEQKLQNMRVLARQFSGENPSVFMRVKAYEGQKTAVQQAEARLAETMVRSPAAGHVRQSVLAPGLALRKAQPVLSLVPRDMPLRTFSALLPENAPLPEPGAACLVRIAGSEEDFSGKVARTEPDARAAEDADFMPVRVFVELDEEIPYDLDTLPENLRGTITLLPSRAFL